MISYLLQSEGIGATFVISCLISWRAFLTRSQLKHKGLELSTSPLPNSWLFFFCSNPHLNRQNVQNLKTEKIKENDCGAPMIVNIQSICF